MKLLGFDFGASSGRCMLGEYDGSRLTLSEVHRFQNDPVQIGRHLRWDFPRLFHELKSGLAAAARAGHRDVGSVGVNTWGVDFGLLDEYGELMSNPFHYRDALTETAMGDVREIVPDQELYSRTGIQFMHFNTLYQLFALRRQYPALYERARKLLFMPDLFGYCLTGNATAEYSIASTTAMLDVRGRAWDTELLAKLGLDAGMLPPVTMPGAVLGDMTGQNVDETGIRAKVISVCGHDTAGAVLAAPMRRGAPGAYLSCGTWSLLGVELDEPRTDAGAFEAQYTNEGGYGGTIRFLKNIMGQWMANEIKREYERAHGPISFAEMDEQERNARPHFAFVDVDAPEFGLPGHMTEKIHAFCDRTEQKRPAGLGPLIRCVNESIALSFRANIDALEQILGSGAPGFGGLPTLRVVGGGIKNKSLMRMAAGALNRPVLTGPVEASASGNILAQLLALGEIRDRWDAREIVGRSFGEQVYEPDATDAASWREAVARFRETVRGK
ncbi:MAG: rhamnulokinase [Clostridiales bacterium]|jgi:sugar (pentulose or hexulose) kinase|nr:rhamnulokinase [Clostridiales bacterium]